MRFQKALVVLLGSVAAGATIGCGGDTGPGCTATACDITVAGCQRAIFAATVCEREQAGADPPKVRVLTLDQFRQELDADPSQPTTSDVGWATVFQLLGLLPAGQSIDDATNNTAADNVAAYYDPSTKGVTVIDRGSSNQQDDLLTLSHEFVHSLQDEEVDLEGFQKKWGRSTDSIVAVKALVEGEATLLSAGVLARSVGHDRSETDWPRVDSSLFTSIFGSFDDSPTPFFAAVEGLPYPIGFNGLLQPWLSQSQSGIDAFYTRPRVALIDWIDNSPRASTAVEPLKCYPTAPPDGFVGEDHDTFGIAGTLSIYMAAGQAAATAYNSSGGWRNDTVVTFRPQDGVQAPAADQRAVAWRTHWATTSEAGNFRTAAIAAVPAAHVTLDDRDVLLVAASDAQILTQWDGTSCGTEGDLPAANSDETTTMMTKLHRHRWDAAARRFR